MHDNIDICKTFISLNIPSMYSRKADGSPFNCNGVQQSHRAASALFNGHLFSSLSDSSFITSLAKCAMGMPCICVVSARGDTLQ